MTMLQRQAINIIKKMPDDKIYHIIHILESIEKLFPEQDTLEAEKAQDAYEKLQQYRKEGLVDRDYKAELAERYESID